MPNPKLTKLETEAIARAEQPAIDPRLEPGRAPDQAEKSLRRSESSYDGRWRLVGRAVRTIGRAFRGNNKDSN